MNRARRWLVAASIAIAPLPAIAQETDAGRFVAAAVREMANAGGQLMRQAVLRCTDVAGLARGALGRHWERLNEAQRARYVELYEAYIVATLTRQVARGKAEVVFIEERPIGGGQILVGARVTQSDGRARLMHWRVREEGGRLLIADMLEEGVSMAALHRADLAGWLNANGGDIEAFLTMFAERAKRGG